MSTQFKNFIYYGLGFVIIAGLIAWAIVNKESVDSDNQKTSSGGMLVSQEKYFDFGNISMKNGEVSHIFELKNESSEPVIIKKVETSCMCTIAKISDSSGQQFGSFGMPGHGGGSSKANIKVEAGDTITVDAVFDPAAHGPSGTGLAERTVYIETNSEQTAKIELNIKAVVIQ